MTSISEPPSSICILRLSAIGDVSHAVATVQAIQQSWPETKITWVIGKIEARLLVNLKNIEFIIFDKKAGLRGYRDLNRQLKGRRFDHLLHMQVALRASLATLCISAEKKWGFDRSRAKEGQWLFTNQKVAAQVQPHVAEGFWAFAQAIGATNKLKPQWKMPVAQQDEAWCRTVLNNNSKQQSMGYLVISPAASKLQRNWHCEGYAAVADFAHSNQLQVVLSGGPSSMEIELGENIQKLTSVPIINLIGQTNLPQLLALLKNAIAVVAPDSGPAHMASTVHTPVVGLYAHSNPMRTGPYHSQKHVVSVYDQLLLQQTGKSVAKNVWGKRVKGDNLMTLITIDSVLDKLRQIVANH